MSVIIVGGGMAGATLALAIAHLSQGRLSVALVEAGDLRQGTHPGFDDRAIALAHGTCQQLARIGIWQALASCACPIRQVRVNEQGHGGFVTLQAQDYQIDALGQVVELRDAGQRLFALLQKARNVQLHCPAKVTAVTRKAQGVTVTLQTGATLHGQLLIAADGSHSPIARQCGIQWQHTPYQQLAVIANITTDKPHQGQAFERFTRHGPLAMLPMNDNRSSLVWCHPLAQQDQVMQWSDRQFCQQLQAAFGWRLGRIIHASPRHGWPLTLSQAERQISHRLALVGNAAQTLHPIAGQGFNLGLRDVISLAETLCFAPPSPLTESQSSCLPAPDPGDYRLLAAWQHRRLADRRATIGMTDSLARLFANQWQPLTLCRNLALIAMDHCPSLRHKLAHRALGWVAR